MSVFAELRHATLEADEQVALTESGIFDEEFYCAQTGLPQHANLVRHYLEIGWRWGLQPRANFDAGFLQRFYDAAAVTGPALLTWLELSAINGRLPRNEAEAEPRAKAVRSSELFDPEWYARSLPSDLDPAVHYVLVGEALGWRPSQIFDPAFYRDRYDDVLNAGISPLIHYETRGRSEGRRVRAASERLSYPALPTGRGRRSILLMMHEASRTGAPLLGWSIAQHLRRSYDVISVLLRDGPIESDFAMVSDAVIGPMTWEEWHPTEMSRVADRLIANYRPLYAISNSIETNLLVPPLAQRGVPSVALVHEFASYTRPISKMENVFDWATEVVFPSHIVEQAAIKTFPRLAKRRGIHVLAQGRVDPPVDKAISSAEIKDIGGRIRPVNAASAFVVLGVGSVELRKGVDLFFSVAAATRRIAPELDIRFVWIGGGYDPINDNQYSSYLAEQFDHAQLASFVTILPSVPDLDPAYTTADAFLLSSRLDPQPNVGIDSLTRGLPVVCFAGASGTAEILAGHPETELLVAPHLDAHAAADIICSLARDRELHRATRAAVTRVALQAFDMKRYIAEIDMYGRKSSARLRSEDLETLIRSGVLDPDLALPAGGTAPGIDGLARIVLQQWVVVGTNPAQVANVHFRRPCPGFHPQSYAAAHPDACIDNTENPLAHWLRAGRPSGTWSREVFFPLPEMTKQPMRVALHAHFFYEDLAQGLADRLGSNATPCDLFLSTDTELKAGHLRSVFNHFPGALDIAVVPNRGRDIAPFLTCLRERILGRGYDVVGHVHGKRSLGTDAAMGDRWRHFLWENLIGFAPLLDTAAFAFHVRPKLGLLIAEDPHLVGWDGNRELAEVLAARMGLRETLDEFFDFPLGTMFWARPEALESVVTLGLTADDFPPEPVPYDGTSLHALERLIPFIVRDVGMTVAGLRSPGTTW